MARPIKPLVWAKEGRHHMNSRAKGCRGEREFRDVLREAGFCKAYRTQQYSGKTGQACDVTCPELPTLHFEVKRTERGNLYDWIEQACQDIGYLTGINGTNRTPVVAHKRNNRPWLAILPMDDFLTIVRRSDLVKTE